MGKRKRNTKQKDLFDIQEYLKTAPCVPAIRNAVNAWRENNYKGVTPTTKELLNYWFYTDHRLPDGRKFAYYKAQKEAIETDRKSVVQGKSVDLGGRRIIKKKKEKKE